jgi:hypothetical protein
MREEKATWKELNPQQAEFLSCYLDPKSETWGNAKQSALKAKYTLEYADNITSQMPIWLSEALQDNNLVQKALINLADFLGDEQNASIRADMTKFTLTRLAKGKFSERQEVTGKDGKDLPQPIIKIDRE